MSKFQEVNQKIEQGVVDGYKKIEDGVVNGYKKIEEGVVSGFRSIEDRFIDTFLAKEGETTEEARARINEKGKLCVSDSGPDWRRAVRAGHVHVPFA